MALRIVQRTTGVHAIPVVCAARPGIVTYAEPLASAAHCVR